MAGKHVLHIFTIICILLVVLASSESLHVLTESLQATLGNPHLSDSAKLFSARFLYAENPEHLDSFPELKEQVTNASVEDMLKEQPKNDQKSKQELREILEENEERQRRVGSAMESNEIFSMILLLMGLTGAYFLARFITNPSWGKLSRFDEPPGFGVGLGILSLAAFLLLSGMSLLESVIGPLGRLLPAVGAVVTLVASARYLREKGVDLWKAIGLSGADHKRAIKVGIAGYLAFIPIRIVLATQGPVLSYFLHKLPQGHPAVEEFLETSSPWLAAVIAVQVMLAAPLIEEIFFRGLFFRPLAHKISPWLACIAAGLIFGLVHGAFLSVFIITFLGMYLCFLYQKTRSLVTPIVVHFLFNAETMIQVLLVK